MGLRKLAVLLGTVLCSINAHAGYIQYKFNSDEVDGYFIQNDEDFSIAYFELFVGPANDGVRTIAPYNGFADIASASRQVNQSLGRFNIVERNNDGFAQNIHFSFAATGNPSVYNFTSHYTFEHFWTDGPIVVPPLNLYTTGTITLGTVDPLMAECLDNYLAATNGERYDYSLRHVVPVVVTPKNAEVSEPSTAAALALGLMSLISARRRK